MPRDMDNGNKTIRCSFCNRTQDEVDKLVAGPGVFICDECIELCKGVIDAGEDDPLQRRRGKVKNEEIVLPKPSQIKEKLDEYVIGQDFPFREKRCGYTEEQYSFAWTHWCW